MNTENQRVSGKRVRRLRQIELAAKAGIDRNYTGFLVHGERTPSIEVIAKISDALTLHQMNC